MAAWCRCKESVEVNGNYELAKLIYRKYKVDSYNKANETNNKTNSTQGGGATSVGSLRHQPLMFLLIILKTLQLI